MLWIIRGFPSLVEDSAQRLGSDLIAGVTIVAEAKTVKGCLPMGVEEGCGIWAWRAKPGERGAAFCGSIHGRAREGCGFKRETVAGNLPGAMSHCFPFFSPTLPDQYLADDLQHG